MRAASSQVFTSKEPCFSPPYCDLQIHVISPVQEQVLNKSHPHTQGLPGYLRYFLHLQPGKGRPLSPLTLVFWDIRSRGSEPQRLPAVCTKETYDKAVETHWFHHSRSMVFHLFLKCYSMLFHVIHVLFMLFPLSEMIRRDLNFSWL